MGDWEIVVVFQHQTLLLISGESSGLVVTRCSGQLNCFLWNVCWLLNVVVPPVDEEVTGVAITTKRQHKWQLTGSRTAGSPFSPFTALTEAWGKHTCNPQYSTVNAYAYRPDTHTQPRALVKPVGVTCSQQGEVEIITEVGNSHKSNNVKTVDSHVNRKVAQNCSMARPWRNEVL